MKNYTIPSTVQISEEELDNIVDSAISWCHYWCDLLEYGKSPEAPVSAMSEAITRGGTLVFSIDEPYEDGGERKFELTLDKLLNGLAEYGEFDFEDFDGPMSDAAVQQALFGEVVFG